MPSALRPRRRSLRPPAADLPVRRPALSAGDLLRTAAALQIHDAATLARLARQLGLGPRMPPAGATESAAGGAAVPRPPLPPERPPRPPEPRRPDGPVPTGDAERPAGGPPGAAAQARLLALPPLRAATDRPAWLAADSPALAPGSVQPPPAPDPLFPPATTRALGAALAAVRSADGDIDTDRLVTALAARAPLSALPRQPAWTLRRGLQVLVDTGPGMDPFEADVQQLLAVLDRVVGRDRLQVQAFEGEPLLGAWPPAPDGLDDALPPADARAGWRPPAPGVPVLVLSDLGIGRPPGGLPPPVGAWRRFAEAAAQRGHPLRALLPYAPARWPAGLPRSLVLLAWDRRTSVAAVRRLLAG